MNIKFLNTMLTNCKFPEEASKFFLDLADKLINDGYEKEFDKLVDSYTEHVNSDTTDGELDAFAKKTGTSKYSCWMLLLLLGAEKAKVLYDKRGVTDDVFYDTFSDLKYKTLECMEEHGEWGTFVAFWYGLFFTCRIIKFGRFEYEDGEFEMMNPYELGNIKITNGTPLKGIHIPSSGEPFTLEDRIKSYKMAYDFYTKETGLDHLYCDCGSWLLFPDYRDVFPEGGCARDFMEDFDIIRRRENKNGEFHDAWRVFGGAHRLPVEEYPENTRMRRNFKKYMLDGGAHGEGIGILVFDGEKLLTRDAKTL